MPSFGPRRAICRTMLDTVFNDDQEYIVLLQLSVNQYSDNDNKEGQPPWGKSLGAFSRQYASSSFHALHSHHFPPLDCSPPPHFRKASSHCVYYAARQSAPARDYASVGAWLAKTYPSPMQRVRRSGIPAFAILSWASPRDLLRQPVAYVVNHRHWLV